MIYSPRLKRTDIRRRASRAIGDELTGAPPVHPPPHIDLASTLTSRSVEILVDADDVWIESRAKLNCDVPGMTAGNRPADGGSLIIEDEEYGVFVKREPRAIPFIKQLVGSAEFINNRRRYCLYLFRETMNPDSFVIVPAVSSENRIYVPIGFAGKDIIA